MSGKYTSFGKIFTFMNRFKNVQHEVAQKLTKEVIVEWIMLSGNKLLLQFMFIFLIGLFEYGMYEEVTYAIGKFEEKLNNAVNKSKKSHKFGKNSTNDGRYCQRFVDHSSIDIVSHLFSFLGNESLKKAASVRMSWVHPCVFCIQQNLYKIVNLGFGDSECYLSEVKKYARRVQTLSIKKFIESSHKKVLQSIKKVKLLSIVNIHSDFSFIKILELVQPSLFDS